MRSFVYVFFLRVTLCPHLDCDHKVDDNNLRCVCVPCLHVCLSVCVSVYLVICWTVCLFLCLCVSGFRSGSLCLLTFVSLSVCLPACPHVWYYF